jgi:hypothetical protein
VVLDFISYTISRSEFFEKIYAKSRSENTVQTANSPYKLKQFFKRQVLPFTNPFFGGLKKEMGTTCSPTKVLRYFGEFVVDAVWIFPAVAGMAAREYIYSIKH